MKRIFFMLVALLLTLGAIACTLPQLLAPPADINVGQVSAQDAADLSPVAAPPELRPEIRQVFNAAQGLAPLADPPTRGLYSVALGVAEALTVAVGVGLWRWQQRTDRQLKRSQRAIRQINHMPGTPTAVQQIPEDDAEAMVAVQQAIAAGPS